VAAEEREFHETISRINANTEKPVRGKSSTRTGAQRGTRVQSLAFVGGLKMRCGDPSTDEIMKVYHPRSQQKVNENPLSFAQSEGMRDEGSKEEGLFSSLIPSESLPTPDRARLKIADKLNVCR
jgi:hypothetical protein